MGGYRNTPEQVYNYLAYAGPATTNQMSRDLGLPKTSIWNAIRRLRKTGVLITHKIVRGNHVPYKLFKVIK
jgi:DNA-binding Lrp family transcriptional regulator